MPISYVIAIIAILTIIAMVAKIGGENDEETTQKMLNLPLDEMLAMNRLTISAIGFLILAVALWSIGQ